MAHHGKLIGQKPLIVHTRPAIDMDDEEYRENGAQLGWLLDPVSKQVHIYRPGTAVEIANNPTKLSGEPLLGGFVLDVPQIWAVMERKR